MSKRMLFASIFCGLIAIGVQPVAAATPSLAGSWQFTLTATTPTPDVVIPGLATFTTDGSAIETDGSEFAVAPSSTPPPKASTPGHGIWQLANTPQTLYVHYISLVLDSDGALYAHNVTSMFLTVDPTTKSTFAGTYTTVQVIGTLSKILSSGTVAGRLIPHVPLP